jgi:hypothetical protein
MGQHLGFVRKSRLSRILSCQCAFESLIEVLLSAVGLLLERFQFASQCQVALGQPDFAVGLSLWDGDASLPRGMGYPLISERHPGLLTINHA